MANSTYAVIEARFVLEPELTHLYVRCSPDSDGGMLVGGWYHKVLPVSVPALDALVEALTKAEYLLWERGAPPATDRARGEEDDRG